MRDHRADIQSSLEESGQAIPRIEQTSAGDPVDPYALEDDFIRKIETHRSRGNPEETHSSAVFDRSKGQMQRSGVAGHFQRGIDAVSLGNVPNGRRKRPRRFRLRIEGMINSHLFG